MSEKNAEYVDSIQGRLASLKASWQEFSQDILNSDLVKGLIKSVNVLVETLDWSVNVLGGYPAKIGAATLALVLLKDVIEKISNTKLAEKLRELAGNSLTKYISRVRDAKVATEEFYDAEEVAKAGVKSFANELLAIVGAIIIGFNIGKGIGVFLEKLFGMKGSKEYDKAFASYSDNEDTIQAISEEIASLESLQTKLKEARGDREALISIYPELNEKISASASLMDGEKEAYLEANAAIEEQLRLKKDLLEQEKKEQSENALKAFKANVLPRTEIFGIKANWLPDNSTETARIAAREYSRQKREADELAEIFNKEPDYSYADDVLKRYGVSVTDWNDYWDEQVEYALTAYSDSIEKFSGAIGKENLPSFIEAAVRSGADSDEIEALLNELGDNTLSALVNAFNKSIYDPALSDSTSLFYQEISNELDALSKKYPYITGLVNSFKNSLTDLESEGISALYKEWYESISMSTMLDTYQEPFDLLTSALEELQEYGDLSADSIKKLLDSGIDLPDEFGKTAESCTLAADALDRYVEKLLNEAIAAVAAAKSTDELNIARENANRLITTLTILNKTYERSNRKKAIDAEKDALKAQKKALEDEKDVLEDQKDALDEQLDAYKELIDYRKELIESYQKEVEYQRELERKQQNLAKLQARLSAAQLDTSAAGRGRARDIQEQVAEAQQELDDYTLEHAVDILVDQLDDQYSEYENFINEELAAIDNQTQALDDRGKSIEDTISNLDTTPEVYVDTSSIADMIAQATAELDRTAVERNEYLSQIAENTNPINYPKTTNILSPSRFGDSRKNALTSNRSKGTLLSFAEFNARPDLVRKYRKYDYYLSAMHGLGIYHSGGAVGGDEYLKSNEEFAKLMKGEYVSTPKQMETFLSKTLPTMANSIKSGNEFNAPLVSVSCENVTQDSLPGLREIIDEAVEKVQKKLVDGFNRTGFKSPINKKLAT